MHENLNKKLKCYIFENASLSVYIYVKLVLILKQIEFNLCNESKKKLN